MVRSTRPQVSENLDDECKRLTRWREHSSNMRRELQVPLKYAPWTSQSHIQLRGVRTERSRELIDIAWCDRLASFPGIPWEVLAKGFYVDLSTSVHFRPWRHDSIMALCKGTVVYSFEADMCFRGRHNLATMGMPNAWGARLGDASSQRMAGQAFAAPCIASATMAFYLNKYGPWWGNSKGP
jgi:hypothetical protein